MLHFQNEGEKNSICKKRDDKKTLRYKKAFILKPPKFQRSWKERILKVDE